MTHELFWTLLGLIGVTKDASTPAADAFEPPTTAATAEPPVATMAPRLSWVVELPGPLSWAPQILATPEGEKLVIVASDDDHVYALDSENGELVWQHLPDGTLWADSVAVVGSDVVLGSEGG